MIEKLSPALAKTVVGHDYDPECTYELETDGVGMRVIITKGEETTVQELSVDQPTEQERDPLLVEPTTPGKNWLNIGTTLILIALCIFAVAIWRCVKYGLPPA